MNAINRLQELQEKAKREALTEVEKAEWRAVMHQWGLESELAMLEKQVRMLVELSERSPVLKGKLNEEIVKALEPMTEYVIVERQQMNVLLEGLEVHAFLVRNLL
jgi:hypothetical protein